MTGTAGQIMRRAQPWLGTLVDVGIVLDDAAGTTGPIDADAGGRAIDATFAAIAQVHRLMSFHEAGSDVSAINRLQPGQSVTVDAHTANVLRCAQLFETLSDGIFNIACGMQLVAWGQLPPPADLLAAPAAASASVTPGTASVAVLQPPTRNALAIDVGLRVTRRKPGLIDLGGIAKGYAVDLAVAALQGAGVAAGCVNAGGDLRVFGAADFPVQIRDPGMPTQAGCLLHLRNQALATSAGYFSSRLHEGRSTGALLDARDGRPVAAGRSASVLAPSCMHADALTKVVIATADPAHPLLTRFGATAFLI